MRVAEVWREAARNFAAGASHGVVSMIVFLAVALCLGGIAIRAVADIAVEADAFRQAGASVFRLDSPGAIDGRSCDALARVGGVDAAGATRARGTLRFALLPRVSDGLCKGLRFCNEGEQDHGDCKIEGGSGA